MKKNEQGLYETTKYIVATGQLLVGMGATREDAKTDLKAKVKAYREEPLAPTGEYLNSPGYVYSRNDEGKVSYKSSKERKAQVLARPELAAYLKEINKAN